MSHETEILAWANDPASPINRDCDNPVYKELRQIYCCKGAAFCRPTLEKAWKEIERLDAELSDAREAMSMCDDIALNQPLAGCISDLQSARNLAERTREIPDTPKSVTPSSVRIANVLAKHCTGSDDHDHEQCHKCADMLSQLLEVL